MAFFRHLTNAYEVMALKGEKKILEKVVVFFWKLDILITEQVHKEIKRAGRNTVRIRNSTLATVRNQ